MNHNHASNILIVEDEIKIASLLQDYLRKEGFNTHCIGHGDAVMGWLADNPCDAILLDLMLPGKDGISLCKEIRADSEVAILMLTARVDEIDRLLGLELGADDYICKPFSPREVVARVKSVLRRSLRQPAERVEQAGWQLDDDRFQATFRQHTLAFTSVEYKMLKQLCAEPGRIYSRNQLMDVSYSDHRIVSDRTIDSHIKKIRKKFLELFPSCEFIHSVYGAGYRFEILDNKINQV